ncbi:DNRLRE domain-containing protein [[Clostridium] symbiosum]|uniref:DNRLRE domain-containing protein n=1 Tax=Clostridium symbiosum TaxID=1512 RepID=A0AAW5FAR1_CLOSY|nr:DNRLRE domain-containing protein [[Clostridium] symbiosum]MCK0088962.1 DNRLRE domain-containing protein [[Clostridium] symbiosum]
MKENKRKVKKRYRQKARQFISGLLITAMLAPNMTPIIAQAAELIENQPRYVDFTRPQALTLRELGIESGVSDTSDGDRADRTENSAEPDKDSDTGKDSESGKSSEPGKDNETGQDSGTGKEDEPGRDSEPGKEDESGQDSGTGKEDEPGQDNEAGKEDEPGKDSGTGKEDEPGQDSEAGKEDEPGQDSEAGKEDEPGKDSEAGKEDEPGKDSEPGKEDEPAQDSGAGSENGAETKPGGSADGGDPADNPAAGPAEGLPEEDAKEEIPGEIPVTDEGLRLPEELYQEVTEEPSGVLVQFSDLCRTYQTGDREYVTVIGGYSGLYRDKDGKVRPIDNTLVKGDSAAVEADGEEATPSNASFLRSKAASWVENEAGPVKIRIPLKMSTSRGVSIETEGGKIELIPSAGNFKEPSVAGNAIRFNDVFENVDYQYTVIENTVKGDIFLLEKGDRYEFSYKLKIPGMTAKQEKDKISIYGKDTAKALFQLDAPFMEDDSGERSDKVKLKLSGTKGNYTVTIKADKKWLNDEERSYPVRIDPDTYVPSDEFIFATISQGQPDTIYDWDSPAYVGYLDGSRKNCRVCVIFNENNSDTISKLLSGAEQVHNATLKVTTETDNSGGQNIIELHVPVTQWNGYITSWNTQPDYNPSSDRVWQTPAPGAGQTMEFDITDLVNGWITVTEPPLGLMFRSEIEADGGAYAMKAEVLCNRGDSVNGPRLEYSWTGDLEGDLANMSVDDTTIEVDPAVIYTDIFGRSVTGVIAHGKAQAGSEVTYRLLEEGGGDVTDAMESLVYPDFRKAGLEDDFDLSPESNWQTDGFEAEGSLEYDTIYYFEAFATGKEVGEDGSGEEEPDGDNTVVGATVTSDQFLLYEVKEHDLSTRIARHYGINVGQLARDNKLYKDQLTEKDTILFIRNPKTAEPYNAYKDMTPLEELLLRNLLAGINPNCELNLEPVNMNTGDFFMQQTDASMKELNGEFGVMRSYNSTLPDYHQEFGYGWTSEFGDHLTILKDGTILYKRSDGKGIPFTRNGDVYQAPDGWDITLEPLDAIEVRRASASEAEEEEPKEREAGTRIVTTKDLDDKAQLNRRRGEIRFGFLKATSSEAERTPIPDCAGWQLTNQDGSRYVFDALGLLQYREDMKGRRTWYRYDEDYKLLQAESPTGRILDITMDDAYRITDITLPDGNTLRYEYDEEGNLISVTNPEGDIRRYEYDEKHRMTAWYDEEGNRVVENEYDSENRITAQTDANGNTSYLSYSDGATVLTDNRGFVTRYEYDGSYRTTKITYPDGAARTKTYRDGRVAQETDEEGNTTSYTYDADGNILTVTRADGARAEYAYNAMNLPLAAEDFEGNRTVFTYDEKGNLLTRTSGEGNTWRYAYDELSRLVSVTDANGQTTEFSYDGAVVTQMKDAEGYIWRYDYDRMNRMLSMVDPLGNAEIYTYNRNGWKINETAKDGGTTEYEYSPAGAVLSITDPAGAKTVFTYDKMYHILTGEDALGHTLTYGYDKNYNRIVETDAKGNETWYRYDERNRRTAVTDAMGRAVMQTFNGNGNLTSSTDRRGNTVSWSYNTILNLPESATDSLGNRTAYSYDKNGQPTAVTYADGSGISYAYDREGRVIRMTAKNGLVTEITYDGNGNIIAVSDDGTRVYHFTYDRNNRLVKTEDPQGGTAVYTYDGAGNLKGRTNEEGHETRYAYDAAGRLQEIKDAVGGAVSLVYDLNGNVLKTTDQNGHSSNYHYDVLGELLAIVNAEGHVTGYSYDELGNLKEMTDALKGQTAYTYDELSRTVRMTDPMGNPYLYEYDENGNLLTVTLPDGDTVTFTYDANNQVTSSTDEAGVVTSYEYDSMGRITRASDTAGNTMTYEYDISGNLVKQTDTIGRSAVYEYDRFNRLTAVTGTDLATTRYAYDTLDRLTGITLADNTATIYEYDKTGNLIKTTEPGEAVYTYTYDAISRLTGKVDPLGAAIRFVYDPAGNLTGTTDAEGAERAYTYDAVNRMIAERDGRGGVTGYEYDELSRLISYTTPEGNKEEYRYDAVDNLTKSKDANGLITEYRYDVMGNLVEKISPKGAKTGYTYDKHDELLSITDPAGNVTRYEVDLNRLVTKMTQKNGGTYTYTYDPVHRLTGITTPLGLKREFTYDVADNIITDTDSLDRSSSYEYDIMHRMTRAVDPEGGVTEYGYDIRGNQNAVTNALGYTWNFRYDLVDQLTASVDPEGKATEIAYNLVGRVKSVTRPGERTTSYQYDKNYNVTGIADPKGYLYQSVYDSDNRRTGTVDPLGQTTEAVYDPGSRITSVTDKMGLTEKYEYDPHGNILAFTSTDGLITRFNYDILDKLVKVTMPSGLTTRYSYDVMGNVTSMTDTMKRVTKYTYDLEGNMLSLVNEEGRREQMTYDAGGRTTSFQTNSGDTIRYDYNRLNALVEKSYESGGEGSEAAAGDFQNQAVRYGYDALGQRVTMMDATGESSYEYDSLGRITQVKNGSGQTTSYAYDGADQLASITYPDGKTVSYEYDKNDNITKVTGRDGGVTTYVYDAINRVTEIHRPNGVSTYNSFNARDQITSMVNKCDDCGWVVSQYDYTYDDRGFIVGETALESLYAYAWDDKHDGRHEDGRHDDKYPHGNRHNNKHDKDAKDNYQIVETKRSFEYDDDGKLIKATEKEEQQGTYVYRYSYDDMGNRISYSKTRNGTVQESAEYSYNASNQLIRAKLYDGKKNTTMQYEYDADGNLISEIGKKGTDKVELHYTYTVENRLKAVHDAHELVVAMAYDGDGNRVFQLNYNLHTDDDWKGNSGNGNGNNKDNTGNGNNGNGNKGNSGNKGNNGSNGNGSQGNSGNGNKQKVSSVLGLIGLSGSDETVDLSGLLLGEPDGTTAAKDMQPDAASNENGENPKSEVPLLEMRPEPVRELLPIIPYGGDDTETEAASPSEASANSEKKNDNGNNGNNGNGGNGNHYGWEEGESGGNSGGNGNGNSGNVNSGNGNNGNGGGNTNNTGGSGNQSGILMPQKPVSDIEQSLIDEIRQTGHHKNYELIEYVNDVNRQYAQVLMEVNIDGEMDTAYTYGNERIALERFTGWTGYYTHDPRGSVSGVTDSGGRLWKSYRYGPTGDITFGKPQYNNSYAYNAEDYNPNLEVQYLRARYYDVERGNFLTEDTYLGKLTDPLTLNRYNYVKSSAPNYVDPSGHKKQSWTETADQAKKNWQEYNKMPVQDYDSGPDYGSKNKELLEELDKKLSTARTKLKKLMDAAEEKGRSVIGYCSDYKAGMDAGRKIAEAEYHNWELTLLFGKNAYRRDDYFWDTDLQEIYDQARNASNNKDAFRAGFTAGQTMFTIEILSLIVGALESGGSSSGGQQVVLPGVGEVTIPGDAAGSVAGVLPPGSILRAQENKKESEEEGKGDSEAKIQPGDETPKGREYTQHGAERANERGFDSQKVDSIIDNNYKHRTKEIDKLTGKVTWRYQDKRGNTVITNEWGDKIVTVYSYPTSTNGGNYIPKN